LSSISRKNVSLQLTLESVETQLDQTIIQLGFLQCDMVVVDQSDACLQRMLSYPWVSKPEGNPSC